MMHCFEHYQELADYRHVEKPPSKLDRYVGVFCVVDAS